MALAHVFGQFAGTHPGRQGHGRVETQVRAGGQEIGPIRVACLRAATEEILVHHPPMLAEPPGLQQGNWRRIEQ